MYLKTSVPKLSFPYLNYHGALGNPMSSPLQPLHEPGLISNNALGAALPPGKRSVGASWSHHHCSSHQPGRCQAAVSSIRSEPRESKVSCLSLSFSVPYVLWKMSPGWVFFTCHRVESKLKPLRSIAKPLNSGPDLEIGITQIEFSHSYRTGEFRSPVLSGNISSIAKHLKVPSFWCSMSPALTGPNDPS